ncbi:MAG: UDP-N-acetylmuramoyl-tripeptide--D-alanyl-D-alanine ligase [Calditrichaceae bacterium]
MLNLTLHDFEKLSDVTFHNIDYGILSGKMIKGISIDSRTIEPDEVFWAIEGDRFDGHDYLMEVNQKSALFSVVARHSYDAVKNLALPLLVVPDTLKALHQLAAMHRNKYDIPVIAVTGSNGKTTTKEMISHILKNKFTVHKTSGNLNNHIGCPLTLLRLNEIHQAAVIEIGTNHHGEIAPLAAITRPNHAIITNIGDTHLEFFKDRKGVAREKLSLFDSLEDNSTIYLNLDDPFLKNYEKKGVNVITYSFSEKAVTSGQFIKLDSNGCGVFRLNDKTDIHLSAAGIHNTKNALAASAIALNLGFSEREIKNGLETYAPVEKRMQIIDWRGVTIVNDAYNANPASMEIAIDTVFSMKKKNKVFLALGDMFELGETSFEMHLGILNYAVSKEPSAIFLMGDMMKSVIPEINKPGSTEIRFFDDHTELATSLARAINSGDIILIKGSRGMQMEKIIGNL